MSEEKTTRSFGPYLPIEPPMFFMGEMADRFLARKRGEPPLTIYRILPLPYFDIIQLAARHFPDPTPTQIPHQLSIIEIGSFGGIPYMAEENVEGLWLDELIAKEQALPPELAAQLMIELCEALQALFEELPQDLLESWELHPRHIRLTHSGEAKLSLSSVFHELDRRARRLSTSGDIVISDMKYLSVEQIRGLPPEPNQEDKARSMIFVLGIVLCELLGRSPFGNGTSIHTLINTITKPPEIPESTPERLRAVIEKALRKDASCRYQSFAQFAQELRASIDEIAVARVDVGALSMALSGGNHHARVEQELERLRELRWLSPDAEMSALAPEAIDWIEMRIDEHLSLLSPYAGAHELPTRSPKLSRSYREITAELQDAESRTLPEEVFSYIKAQYAARQRAENICSLSLEATNAAEKASSAGFANFLYRPPQTEKKHELNEILTHQGGRRIVDSHLRHIAIYGDALPSPWEPILQLWERGLWPLEMLSEGFLVYVPLYRGESLVVEPTK
jgi:serine/threonine protein kinase